MRYKNWSKEKQHYLYQKYPQSLSGFTLIELLVVVSIIGMLAAILLPALSGARQRAQKASCISNLRQLSMSLTSYADDYNGLYPIAGADIKWDGIDSPPLDGTGTHGWMQQIFSYVNDKKLYSCLANKEFPEYAYFLGTRAAWMEQVPPPGPFPAAVHIRKIQYPSAFVLSGDTTTDPLPEHSFTVDDCDKDDYVYNCVGGQAHLAVDKWKGWQVHMQGQNILFADGHADWFRGYVKDVMTFRYDRLSEW